MSEHLSNSHSTCAILISATWLRRGRGLSAVARSDEPRIRRLSRQDGSEAAAYLLMRLRWWRHSPVTPGPNFPSCRLFGMLERCPQPRYADHQPSR